MHLLVAFPLPSQLTMSKHWHVLCSGNGNFQVVMKLLELLTLAVIMHTHMAYVKES